MRWEKGEHGDPLMVWQLNVRFTWYSASSVTSFGALSTGHSVAAISRGVKASTCEKERSHLQQADNERQLNPSPVSHLTPNALKGVLPCRIDKNVEVRSETGENGPVRWRLPVTSLCFATPRGRTHPPSLSIEEGDQQQDLHWRSSRPYQALTASERGSVSRAARGVDRVRFISSASCQAFPSSSTHHRCVPDPTPSRRRASGH